MNCSKCQSSDIICRTDFGETTDYKNFFCEDCGNHWVVEEVRQK